MPEYIVRLNVFSTDPELQFHHRTASARDQKNAIRRESNCTKVCGVESAVRVKGVPNVCCAFQAANSDPRQADSLGDRRPLHLVSLWRRLRSAFGRARENSRHTAGDLKTRPCGSCQTRCANRGSRRSSSRIRQNACNISAGSNLEQTGLNARRPPRLRGT